MSASEVATRHELIMSLVAGLNPIMTRCEDQPLNKAEIRRGASDQRKRSHDASRTYHEPCCWSEPDYEGVEASAYEPVRNRIMMKIRAIIKVQ